MKSGIDYFPLDVSLNDKMELIEAEFGLTGFAVVVKLFQKIYGGQGYYCEWTYEVALLFGKRLGLGGNVVSEIIKASVNRGIFDKDMYDKYQILTSAGIQKRYFEAVSRRKAVNVKKQYLLVSCMQNFVFDDISGDNANKNNKNAYIFGRSKVEESKVKKSKVKKSKEVVCAEPETVSAPEKLFPLLLNDGSLYGFTAKQVEEWESLYPGVDVRQALRNMQAWCKANPSRRKTKNGVMRFVTNWLASDQNSGRNRRAQSTAKVYTDTDDFCALMEDDDGC